MRVGYFLSTEEYSPDQLLEQARAAEKAGFSGLWISDHFHPWNDEQGQSGFVWSLIGAISQVCDLPITTAVTCPTVRIHPAIIAQAAATSAVLTKGRFILGVGSGEALNEHILGDVWPAASTRQEMLEEAIELIRELWRGESLTTSGRHYQVDRARIYTLPDEPPPIYVSAFGEHSLDLACRVADGLITTQPDTDSVRRFKDATAGKPCQAGFKVAYAPTRDEGVAHAHRLWANSGIPGELAQELPSPQHFEQASQLVSEDDTRQAVVAGNDASAHMDKIKEYADAGFDELFVSNMGPHALDMIEFYAREIIPAL